MAMATPDVYDVAVIGAGVVGAAIARELTRYELSVALVEAAADVGMGTSKASTAIWHTGFDAKPGSLEARLMRRGYGLMEVFTAGAGIPVERTGGLLVAWNAEQQAALPALLDQAQQNGVSEARLVESDDVYRLEPCLGPGATGGMLVPGEGILCTYTVPLACATQAVINGARLKLNHAIGAITADPAGYHVLESPAGPVRCRYLVNAAGLYSDEVNQMMGQAEFSVTPRRGELIIFDKLARPLVRHVILPVPTAKTKGVLISPTVYGNVLLGPTAEDLATHSGAKRATDTTAAGLRSLLEKGRTILPDLLNEEVTATYAGLRAATEHSDYQIKLHAEQCYVCAGGIRSTGVSASLGIAEYVVGLLAQAGLRLRLKAEFKPVRMPNIGEVGVRPYQSAERIAADPRYGQIVCHCERVSLGELLDATQAVIPARTLDGLRRRTRALQGRCQGFNCHAALIGLLLASYANGQSASQFARLEAAHAA
jgi:glycerol-3-phosphate dehydrogenase